MTAIEWALLEPVVSVDAWLRLGLPGGIALLLPVLMLALAAGLVAAVVLAARSASVRARVALRVEGSERRIAPRIEPPAWSPRRRPVGGCGPRAPGLLLSGS